MNKTTAHRATVRVALVLAMAFTFSCSGGGDDSGGGVESSSSEGSPQSYSYCLINEMCLDGPYTFNDCNSIGGLPSNSCPYGGVEPSSSSVATPSSSSVVVAPSSSSAVPSSSSAVPSSSSATPPSSSSLAPISSSSSSSSSLSSSSSSAAGGNSISYEGQTYGIVTIGTQTWMAENLNYNNASGSKCYDNKPANCTKYGRLYNWATAKTVCPTYWHLPTQAEWNTLSSYVQSNSGCSDCDAKLLKATSGWNNNGNDTDKYGFSALPGGFGYSRGSFGYVGSNGYWWSASEYDASYAFSRYMRYDDHSAGWVDHDKGYLFSVRCVKD